MKLTPTEFERLVQLFPYPRSWSELFGLGAEARAALMVNNYPKVAENWLREEGLLDSQLEEVETEDDDGES